MDDELHRYLESDDTSLKKPRLKPCPFCGGEPKLGPRCDWSSKLSYSIQCRCGVSGPVFIEHRHLAVQGWNKMVRREP